MAVSKSPRKKHKAKPIFHNPVQYVVNGYKPLRMMETHMREILIRLHVALDMLRSGQAQIQHMVDLVDALNTAKALAMLDVGREAMQQITAGHDAVYEVSRRGVNHQNRFICRAEELKAIFEAAEYHEQQLQICTVDDFTKALSLVKRLQKSGGRVVDMDARNAAKKVH